MLSVIVNYARACFKGDDGRVADAVTAAWFPWHTATAEQKKLPASVWARAGVRRVLAGRDLPGVCTGRQWGGDPLERPDTYQGGPMGEVPDRRPGPLDLLVGKEALAELRASATEAHRRLIDLVADDQTLGTGELARLLGRSPSRISQMRRELAELNETK